MSSSNGPAPRHATPARASKLKHSLHMHLCTGSPLRKRPQYVLPCTRQLLIHDLPPHCIQDGAVWSLPIHTNRQACLRVFPNILFGAATFERRLQ